MCAAFEISRSSYYAWRSRKQRVLKQKALVEPVRRAFQKSKRHYGSPRVAFELKAEGFDVSRSTVARIMRAAGLVARPRRRYVHTTDSDHSYRIAKNILDRQFTADRVNEKWVSDISYVPTKEGWAYLTVILDLADRMVVSWSLGKDMSCENTALSALKTALERRKIDKPLLFHSDRGVQYCSIVFREFLSRNKLIQQSMSRKGNCWDNAVAESFFKTLKTEWIKRFNYADLNEARRSIFDYIDRWYNTNRRHSAIGYLSPLKKHVLLINQEVA